MLSFRATSLSSFALDRLQSRARPCLLLSLTLLSGWWLDCSMNRAVVAETHRVLPATFDLDAIRDASTLETKVIQDWERVDRPGTFQRKLIEITVCEWWPGQKVRLPVTLCVPLDAVPCRHVVVTNMPLTLKPSAPTGKLLELLEKRGVGIVMVGMGTIDAMEPSGKLHLGMKHQLLQTKSPRYTPAWIWGMSDMRGLTAAMAETRHFRPEKVLVTGGSKRGVGAAVCGLHDDRFTAILPVVAPILADPGGLFVKGSGLDEVEQANRAFLDALAPGPNPLGLPETAKQALLDREARRLDQAITIQQARAAGWTDSDVAAMNRAAWDACRIGQAVDRVEQRGLLYFYHVGTNDNVCPDLLEIGKRYPRFPLYILPGGQHGGPKTSGYTLQTPTQPEADDNLYALASSHFFGDRSIPGPPDLQLTRIAEGKKVRVTVSFAGGIEPTTNVLSLCGSESSLYLCG